MSLPKFETFSVTSFDGTRLQCQRFGDGPLHVVVANGIGGTLIAWLPLLRSLEHRCTFVSWDYRGLYGSAAPSDPSRVTIHDNARDLAAVMDAAGMEEALIFGWSLGVQVSIQAAADLGERVLGLLLVNGTFGRIFETAFPSKWSGRILPKLNQLAIAAAPALPGAIGFAARQRWFLPLLERLNMVDSNLDRDIFTEIAQGFETLDFALYHRMLGEANNHDGEPLLSGITVPILMVTGGRDMMTPHSVTETVQRRAPQTEVFRVPEATHYALIEYPDVVVPRVRTFIDRHFPVGRAPDCALPL